MMISKSLTIKTRGRIESTEPELETIETIETEDVKTQDSISSRHDLT